MSEKKLSEKVILITGAARGLGRSMALALAAEGASLALVDIDGEELKDTAIEIEKINDFIKPVMKESLKKQF